MRWVSRSVFCGNLILLNTIIEDSGRRCLCGNYLADNRKIVSVHGHFQFPNTNSDIVINFL